MCVSCEVSECKGGPCMFGPLTPFQKFMSKTMSSIDDRGKCIVEEVKTLKTGQTEQGLKIQDLEKRADKDDTEKVCILFNTSLAVWGGLTHHLKNPKWPREGSKLADRVWKEAILKFFGSLMAGYSLITRISSYHLLYRPSL